MTPRKFNRYMVAIGVGTHPKLARLTDGEFRAHVVGVLAVAAMAPVRGCLLVGSLPAEAIDIARTAGVPEKVAASAMRKLTAIGVLEPDREHDCLRVHDWEDINPPPKSDPGNAARQRRYRERNGSDNGGSNAPVTPNVTPPEVEVEVELPASQAQQVARKRVARQINQAEPPENFPTDLLSVVDAVLAILRRIWEAKGGIEPMVRGVALGVLRNSRADHVRVALKLEQWLTAGNGRRAACKDVCARFGDWVENEGAALKVIDGGPRKESPSDLLRALRGDNDDVIEGTVA